MIKNRVHQDIRRTLGFILGFEKQIVGLSVHCYDCLVELLLA